MYRSFSILWIESAEKFEQDVFLYVLPSDSPDSFSASRIFQKQPSGRNSEYNKDIDAFQN